MCFVDQCVVVGNLRNCYYGEFSRLGSQAIPEILFWGRGEKLREPRIYGLTAQGKEMSTRPTLLMGYIWHTAYV